jgi:hypothetical protein
MFSVVCDKDIKPESIKPDEKIYMDTSHFLPFARFLPKKVEKGANKGGNKKQQGKGGNFGKGGRGGRGGRGRGFGGSGQQRGGGGYRPQRGGSSGGYRPPRKENK